MNKAKSSQFRRNYPLPLQTDGDDRRFNIGLLFDVGEVLKQRGYPQVDSGDVIELQLALFRFIYKPEAARTPEARDPAQTVLTANQAVSGASRRSSGSGKGRGSRT